MMMIVYMLLFIPFSTELSALQAVIDDAEKELKRLEALMESILSEDPESPLLEDIYERIDAMDSATFEVRGKDNNLI